MFCHNCAYLQAKDSSRITLKSIEKRGQKARLKGWKNHMS